MKNLFFNPSLLKSKGLGIGSLAALALITSGLIAAPANSPRVQESTPVSSETAPAASDASQEEQPTRRNRQRRYQNQESGENNREKTTFEQREQRVRQLIEERRQQRDQNNNNPATGEGNETKNPRGEKLRQTEQNPGDKVQGRPQQRGGIYGGKVAADGNKPRGIGEVHPLSYNEVATERMMQNAVEQVAASQRRNAVLGYNNAVLEIVHTFGKGQAPGNIAVSPEGRTFISLHQFFSPELKIAEVKKDGSLVAYPNADWQRKFEDAGHETLHGVLGLRCDQQGILWMLDRSPGEGEAGKLVAWDTRQEKLHRVIMLERPFIGEEPFLNDLAIDRVHNAIYITDTAAGKDSALIVVDLNTGNVRRVLEGSPFTVPEDIDMVIDGEVRKMGEEPARIGANPITMDPQSQWVYFAPMSGTLMYRVRTYDLLNSSLSETSLREKVEVYGQKPICDGITIDAAGNVYITSVTENAISVLSRHFGAEVEVTHPLTGEKITVPNSVPLFKDVKLSWPDGMAITPEGEIVTTINQLHRSPALSGDGEDKSTGEYYIVKFKPPYDAINGR